MQRFLWMVVLLVGCKRTTEATCASFDETRVTNPDGRAPSDEFADIVGLTEWEIQDFASKTTRDGVCVDEVRLVDWPDDAESWTLPGWFGDGRIELAYGEDTWDVFPGAVTHELCHAFDHAEGWMSLDAEAVFGLDAMEEFAEACAAGPRPVAIDEAMEDACGIDLGTVQQRFVNEEVYDAVDLHETAAAGSVAMALDRTAVNGPQTDADTWRWRAVAGGGGIYLLENAIHLGNGLTPKVYAVDPASGAIEATWELTGVDTSLMAAPSLDGPPVLFSRGSPFWRLGPDGAVTEGSLPGFAPQSGVTIGDEAWLVGVLPDGKVPFVHADLATGDWTEIPLPDGLYSPNLIAFDAGRLVGAASAEDGTVVWVSFDLAEETWITTPLPPGFDELAPLGDGRLVATWSASSWADLATIDLDAGTWRLAADPCDATAIDGDSALLSVDGTAWLWEYAEDGGGHTLARIAVD